MPEYKDITPLLTAITSAVDADLIEVYQISSSTKKKITKSNFLSGLGNMLKSENLSGLSDYAVARTNLGLGTLATQSGTFAGASSGTNTGDQFTTTTAGKLIGRTSASAGAAQEITVGSGLLLSGTTLTATGTSITIDTAMSSSSTNPVTNTAITAALALKADDSAVVKLTGNQTIAGVKTFSSVPLLPNTGDAYDATTWDSNFGVPTKNAIRDKFIAVEATIATGGAPSAIAIGTTIASATQGSVLFVGTAGALAQNNAKLNWDNTNAKLTIGDISISNNGLTTYFIGSNAGNSITTATDNYAFGRNALTSLTSGNANVAIGTNSMVSLTTGIENTAIGAYNCLDAITTGYRNVAIGVRALRSISTGNSNIGIGYNALYLNTAGGSNVAIGIDAAYGKTDSLNVAIGVSTLFGSGTGYGNIAIGHQAGQSHTNGIGNTYIGFQAGQNATTGSSNVCIGEQTGKNIGTSSGNLMLGYTAGIDETGSNKLYIETSYGERAFPLIYGEFDNNVLYFGSQEIRQRFDVNNYFKTTISSTGSATFDLTGTLPEFTFSDPVNVPDLAYNATSWNGSTRVPTRNAVRNEIENLRTAITGASVTDDSITNAKLANMATKTYKGRTSASTGDPEDVSVATLKTDLALTKADVGLSNVVNTNTTTTANIADSIDKRFVTDTQLAAIGSAGSAGTEKLISALGTLTAAINNIGSTVTDLVIDVPVSVTSSVSIPENINIRIRETGIFNVSAGTLTINKLAPHGNRKLFNVTGTGHAYLGGDASDEMNVHWWAGVGSTAEAADQTAALTDIFTTLSINGGGRLLVNGKWKTSTGFTVPANTQITGTDRINSGFVLTSNNTYLLRTVSVTNEVYKNILINNIGLFLENTTGSTAFLTTGAQGNGQSQYNIRLSNIHFNVADIGIDILSTSGNVEIINFVVDNCNFVNCVTNAFRCNTVNSGFVFNNPTIVIPASGLGFRLINIGQIEINQPIIGGGGATVGNAGPTDGSCFIQSEDQCNLITVNHAQDERLQYFFKRITNNNYVNKVVFNHCSIQSRIHFERFQTVHSNQCRYVVNVSGGIIEGGGGYYSDIPYDIATNTGGSGWIYSKGDTFENRDLTTTVPQNSHLASKFEGITYFVERFDSNDGTSYQSWASEEVLTPLQKFNTRTMGGGAFAHGNYRPTKVIASLDSIEHPLLQLSEQTTTNPNTEFGYSFWRSNGGIMAGALVLEGNQPNYSGLDLQGVMRFGILGSRKVHERHGRLTISSGGSKFVSDTSISPNTIILLTRYAESGTFSAGGYTVINSTGTGFTVFAKNADGTTNTGDTSSLNYFIVEPG